LDTSLPDKIGRRSDGNPERRPKGKRREGEVNQSNIAERTRRGIPKHPSQIAALEREGTGLNTRHYGALEGAMSNQNAEL
jgi:hypothetical protein